MGRCWPSIDFRVYEGKESRSRWPCGLRVGAHCSATDASEHFNCVGFPPASRLSSVHCRPLISELHEEEEEKFLCVCWVRKKKRKRRGFWVRNICKKRMIHGEFHSPYPDLPEDDATFFVYFRMACGKFMTLLDMMEPSLSRQNTSFREAVRPKERLALCWRWCVYLW